jgi:hypothetical protein
MPCPPRRPSELPVPLGAIAKASRAVEGLVDELGHARCFSLDTDVALKGPASKLRALAKKR